MHTEEVRPLLNGRVKEAHRAVLTSNALLFGCFFLGACYMLLSLDSSYLQPPQTLRLSSLSTLNVTTIAPITFKGWDAYILSNGLVEVILCPSIARIMAFRFVSSSKDESQGPFWINALLAGQKPDPQSGEWRNFGHLRIHSLRGFASHCIYSSVNLRGRQGVAGPADRMGRLS